MSRRLWLLLMTATALLICATAGATQFPTEQIDVKPHRGFRTTHFVISFIAPDRAGRIGATDRRYEVVAQGPTQPDRCVKGAVITVDRASAGQTVQVTLNPRKAGGKWCVGRFRGRVEEIREPVCEVKPCPAFAILVHQLGTFSFRVRQPTHRMR
jgi:hypothetical protein